MTEKIAEILSKRTAQNIISLIMGLGFFGVVFRLIVNYTNIGGGFLGFVFFPAIFCGAAVVNIKLIRKNIDEKRYNAVVGILLLDIIIFAAGVLFLIEILINYLHF